MPAAVPVLRWFPMIRPDKRGDDRDQTAESVATTLNGAIDRP